MVATTATRITSLFCVVHESHCVISAGERDWYGALLPTRLASRRRVGSRLQRGPRHRLFPRASSATRAFHQKSPQDSSEGGHQQSNRSFRRLHQIGFLATLGQVSRYFERSSKWFSVVTSIWSEFDPFCLVLSGFVTVYFLDTLVPWIVQSGYLCLWYPNFLKLLIY